LLTIDTISAIKRLGWRPLLIARGGVESYGSEVLARATARGLRVVERTNPSPGICGMLGLLENADEVDIISLRSPLEAESRRVLFHASDVVLANSRHEPFGLVGLETMAVGGVACTGCSGEEYAVAGHNALVMETTDPREFLGLFGELRANPALERAIRRAGRTTAKHYSWLQIMIRHLLPRLRLLTTSMPHDTPGRRVVL
jgi:glycosyltransferase involved in cell wall biosynthesis